MLRLVFVFAALSVAGSVSAQSRFYTSCMTASEGDGAMPVAAARALCTCAEAQVRSKGIAPATMDRYADYVAGQPVRAVRAADLPEWVRAPARAVQESMIGCATEARFVTEPASRSEPSPRVQASRPSPGAPARVTQRGAGAAVRIGGPPRR